MGDFYKSDDTGAFGNQFIRIDLVGGLSGTQITKAEFIVGCLCKSYPNPNFPLIINFSSEELQQLGYVNVGYLRVYDYKNRPKIVDGTITFKLKNGVFCK